MLYNEVIKSMYVCVFFQKEKKKGIIINNKYNYNYKKYLK